MNQVCRSRWPPGLRRRSAAACLLSSMGSNPAGAWMFVCCECCVLLDRGLCEELITRPEESYRLWCVVVCDLETSWISFLHSFIYFKFHWSYTDVNQEALAHWGLSRQKQTNKLPGLTLKSSAFFPHSKFLMTNNTLRLFPYNRMKDWLWKMWDSYWSLRYYLHELQVSRPCHSQAVSRRPLPRGPWFHSRPFHTRLVVVKVVLGKVLLRGLRFSPFSIIPSILHTNLHLNTTTAIPEWHGGEAWEPSDKAMLFRTSGAIAYKITYTFFTVFKYQNHFNYDIRKKNVIITNIKYVHLSRYADHSWFIHLAILTF